MPDLELKAPELNTTFPKELVGRAGVPKVVLL
jgi:hypothetical protein